jgi:hypothetical protein
MAMEVPIVATDVDGVREAVVPDQEALLVPARDSKRLAEGIRSVLADPELAKRLSRAAREKVEHEFSFASRMRRVEDIYGKLLGVDSGGDPSRPPESSDVTAVTATGVGGEALCRAGQAARTP